MSCCAVASGFSVFCLEVSAPCSDASAAWCGGSASCDRSQSCDRLGPQLRAPALPTGLQGSALPRTPLGEGELPLQLSAGTGPPTLPK